MGTGQEADRRGPGDGLVLKGRREGGCGQAGCGHVGAGLLERNEHVPRAGYALRSTHAARRAFDPPVLESYCRSNPLETPVNGSIELFRELGNRRWPAEHEPLSRLLVFSSIWSFALRGAAACRRVRVVPARDQRRRGGDAPPPQGQDANTARWLLCNRNDAVVGLPGGSGPDDRAPYLADIQALARRWRTRGWRLECARASRDPHRFVGVAAAPVRLGCGSTVLQARAYDRVVAALRSPRAPAQGRECGSPFAGRRWSCRSRRGLRNLPLRQHPIACRSVRRRCGAGARYRALRACPCLPIAHPIRT